MIAVHNLSKVFIKEPIFSHYSTRFLHNKVCVEAKNGLGKTTLFTIIAGLDPFYEGEILIDGEQPAQLVNIIALASDNIVFPEFLTAEQVLGLTQQSFQCTWPGELIESFSFSAFLATRCVDLSSGNLKKLQLINAMMRNTHYLLLDEPSAALDKQALDCLLGYLECYKGQVIISCHEPAPFLNIGFITQPLYNEV